MEHDVINSIWPEWSIVKKLGKGAYGVVYEAKRTDHAVESRAAIKVITIPESESELASLRAEGLSEEDTKKYLEGIVDDFVKEIQLMESFKGVQNIVSVEDYKVVEKTGESGIGWTICIRMELLTPFNDYISGKSLTEEEVIRLGCDICTALELCARQKVIHRDIKPENIFVNQFGDYKLGDFGIARKLENVTGGLSQKGTYNYMAPEVEKGGQYDQTVDLYSLGLVLYRLLNHNLLPFLTNETQLSPNGRMDAVRKRMDGAEIPMPDGASTAMGEVILKACAYAPAARYQSASEMKKALERVLSVQGASEEEDPLNKTMSVRRAAKEIADPDTTTAVHRAPESFTSATEEKTIRLFGTEIRLPPPKILAAAGGVLAVVILVIVLTAVGGKKKEAEETRTAETELEEIPLDEAAKEEMAVKAILEEAKKSADTGDYFIALSVVKTAREQYPDNETLKETFETYAAEYKKGALAEIREKTDSGDLLGATAKVTEASAMLPEDEELKAMQKQVEDAEAALAALDDTEETEPEAKPTGAIKDILQDPAGAGENIVNILTGEDETSTQEIYLFDEEPSMIDYAYLCMLNNDPQQSGIWSDYSGYYPYAYSDGWKMQSGGKTYSKGMAVTAATGYGYATEIDYSGLDGKYTRLTGKAAFEDKFIERVDKAFFVEIYTDGALAETYTIRKNRTPVDIDVDLDHCSELSILLRQPSDDYSIDPNINLIDFRLK